MRDKMVLNKADVANNLSHFKCSTVLLLYSECEANVR